MKSALPQQAPTPIKMKSVTLLNKREKPYILVKPQLISKESANEQENGCANAQRLSRKLLNPLLCSFRAVCLVSKLELRERSYIRRYL